MVWLLLIGLLLGAGLAAEFSQGSPVLGQGNPTLISTATPARLSSTQPSFAPAEAQPTPEATATEETEAGTRRRYTWGDSQIIFQWDMLIDSLALAVSYAWLCCGILAILGLPVLFIILWVKGTNRRQARQ